MGKRHAQKCPVGSDRGASWPCTGVSPALPTVLLNLHSKGGRGLRLREGERLTLRHTASEWQHGAPCRRLIHTLRSPQSRSWLGLFPS